MTDLPPETLQCLNDEKAQLTAEVRTCDLCSESYEEHHRCYQETARASGERSRDCLTS
jgi:hypothetical protein